MWEVPMTEPSRAPLLRVSHLQGFYGETQALHAIDIGGVPVDDELHERSAGARLRDAPDDARRRHDHQQQAACAVGGVIRHSAPAPGVVR